MVNLLSDDRVIDGDFDDVTLLQDDIDRQIETIIGEFGDEEVNQTRLKVYKTIPNQGKMEWLFDCTPNELPIMERLRDEYGGGKFEARLYVKEGADKWAKLKKKFEILIGEPKKPVFKPSTDNKELVTVMMEGFNKLGELIVASKTQAPQIDPFTMQGQLIQNMVAMKELLGGGEKPAEKDPLTQLKSLVEVQAMLMDASGGGGGANSNDVLLNLANQILPHLAEIGKEEQKLQTIQQRKILEAKQHKARLIKQKQQTEGENPMKMHLIFLTQMAKKDADPMIYAQMVIDNTPLEKLPELVEFITGENALQEMAAIYKPVANYPGWFADLGQCILELVQGANVPESQAPVDTVFSGNNPPGVTGSVVFNVPTQTIEPATETDADD